MTTTTLRSGVSAMVNSAKASNAYGNPANLLLNKTSSTAYAYLQFGMPKDLHKGATVTSAKLRVWTAAAWSGTNTLAVQRVSGKWTASKVTYNNRATVTGSPVSVAATSPGSGYLYEFDVTTDVQAYANGTSNVGWRLSLSDNTSKRYVNGFRASDQKPQLVITYTYAPPTPTSLNPSAAAVSVASPVLSYQSSDATVAHQVQVDAAANGTTPAFDSGEVATTTESFALAGTTYAGLAVGASTQWRVRVRSSNGQLSPWSAWVAFSRVAKQTVTITQPTATVYDPSPPVNIVMTNLRRMRVLVYDSGNKLVHDSGEFASTTGDYTPPKSVLTGSGSPYTFKVRGWDNVVRDETTGDVAYSLAQVVTAYANDGTIPAVATLVAVQAVPAPWVDLTWTRTTAPDGWAVLRNGTEVYRTDAYTDVEVGTSTTYTWRDWGVPPNRAATYQVLPVVNGKTGGTGPTATVTPTGAGLWLADPSTGKDVPLWGDEAGDWVYGEDGTTYTPIGASAPVQVTSSMRGLEGTWSGSALEVPGYSSVNTVEGRLFAMKRDPTTVLRLAAGDINIPVQVYGLTLVPTPASKAGDRAMDVHFSFAQVDELPYSAVL